MKKYPISIDPHELEVMRGSIVYLRAIAQTLGDNSLTAKLKNHAQMLEDVVSRIETMDMAK